MPDILTQIAHEHGLDPIDMINNWLEAHRDGAEPVYVSFEASHVDANPQDSDDAVVKHYIDGYPADEDAPGTVIATVTLTKHDDIVVNWHHNAYRMHDDVNELISTIKAELRKEVQDK